MTVAGAGPVAILAGSDQLPVLLSDRLRRDGRDHRILAFRGFAAPETRRRADAVVDLLDVQGTKRMLEAWQPSVVTLAGAVRRPRLSAFLNTFSAFRNRRELASLMARGDDRLLRSAVELFEEHGYLVVGAHELAPELLAAPDIYTRAAPEPGEARAVAVGFSMLADLAPHDMGQACIVAGERILAIEGPEGTDNMLARVRAFRRRFSRVRVDPGGVLVKTAKHGQDLRVDLPAIGPRTMINARRAGLKGVAVGSGVTLILDQEETIATADRLGLFLVAVEPGHAAAARRVVAGDAG
jgi:UDP-2,3-diacylglucosamine hydrolase